MPQNAAHAAGESEIRRFNIARSAAYGKAQNSARVVLIFVGAAVDHDHPVLDVGRRTRAIPAAIRRALWLRDQGCRFPGCASTRFLHGHHVKHWLHGGRTALTNLVLLCSFHHPVVDWRADWSDRASAMDAPSWDGEPVDYEAAVDALWPAPSPRSEAAA